MLNHGGGASGMESTELLKRPMSCFPFLTQYQAIRSHLSVSVKHTPVNSHPTKPAAMESLLFLRGCGPLTASWLAPGFLFLHLFCISCPPPTHRAFHSSHSWVMFCITHQRKPFSKQLPFVFIHTASKHSLVSFLGPSYGLPPAPGRVPFLEATHPVLAFVLCAN